jgi:hypothetical protein
MPEFYLSPVELQDPVTKLACSAVDQAGPDQDVAANVLDACAKESMTPKPQLTSRNHFHVLVWFPPICTC